MQVSVEGKMVEVSDGASCADALKEGLSGKRFKAAIACKAGDTLLDLTAPVPTTTETLTLTPVTADTPEGLGLIRHSAAHVMAAAVKKLFPAAKVTFQIFSTLTLFQIRLNTRKRIFMTLSLILHLTKRFS